MRFSTYYKSPAGWMEIIGDEKNILEVQFVARKKRASKLIPEHLKNCVRQLDEYFQGKRTKFSLPLKLEGTDFQKKVWKELQKIPLGKTLSYGELAKKAGNPLAARAVGGANNKNKITVIVPCHRVIGTSGHLVGYGGGLSKKQWLLSHEGLEITR